MLCEFMHKCLMCTHSDTTFTKKCKNFFSLNTSSVFPESPFPLWLGLLSSKKSILRPHPAGRSVLTLLRHMDQRAYFLSYYLPNIEDEHVWNK